MTPVAIIRQATAEGLSLVLTPVGTIRAIGDGSTVSRWLPILRQHKPGVLAALKIRRLIPELADELIDFWRDDVADVLQLPDEALVRLAEDFQRNRPYYEHAMKRRH
jgi:hypothetical protein